MDQKGKNWKKKLSQKQLLQLKKQKELEEMRLAAEKAQQEEAERQAKEDAIPYLTRQEVLALGKDEFIVRGTQHFTGIRLEWGYEETYAAKGSNSSQAKKKKNKRTHNWECDTREVTLEEILENKRFEFGGEAIGGWQHWGERMCLKAIVKDRLYFVTPAKSIYENPYVSVIDARQEPFTWVFPVVWGAVETKPILTITFLFD